MTKWPVWVEDGDVAERHSTLPTSVSGQRVGDRPTGPSVWGRTPL